MIKITLFIPQSKRTTTMKRKKENSAINFITYLLKQTKINVKIYVLTGNSIVKTLLVFLKLKTTKNVNSNVLPILGSLKTISVFYIQKDIKSEM